jgi:hypothetical protein
MEVIAVSRTALFRGFQTWRTCESQLTVPHILPSMFYKYNLVRRTKATIMGLGRDGAGLQVAPSNGRGSRATGTVQCVFFRTSCRMRYDVSSVAIGTKTNDISSKAIRTLHTVANTESHRALSQDKLRHRRRLDICGPLPPVVIVRWCRETRVGNFPHSSMTTTTPLPQSSRGYGINSEAKPMRCSICRRTFSGRLPFGVSRTACDRSSSSSS